MTAQPRSQDRGFALLLVLWTMVLLALLTTRITASGRTEAQVAANLRDGAGAEMAADAAVHEAILYLLAGGQGWTPSGYRRVAAAGGAMGSPGVSVTVGIENLGGRVNLNAAPQDMLRALLDALGVEPNRAATLAAAILDWRTPGQRPRPNGAKAPQYQAAHRGYGPPGAPFRNVDELGDVLGMTPALLALLRPHLTIWGGGAYPDPTLADSVVLAAVRMLGRDAPPPGGSGTDALVVAVTAEAVGPMGGRFERYAVVEIIPDPHAKPWRILEWTEP